MKQQLLTVLNKHQSKKSHGAAADVQRQAFLISALGEGKWLATRSDFLTPREQPKQSLVQPILPRWCSQWYHVGAASGTTLVQPMVPHWCSQWYHIGVANGTTLVQPMVPHWGSQWYHTGAASGTTLVQPMVPH